MKAEEFISRLEQLVESYRKEALSTHGFLEEVDHLISRNKPVKSQPDRECRAFCLGGCTFPKCLSS